MATNNFANPQNASKYFVVLMDNEYNVKECNDCNQIHYDYEYELETMTVCENCKGKNITEIKTNKKQVEQWEIDDLIINVNSSIKLHKDGCDDFTEFHDRNYHRKSLGKLTDNESFGDIEVDVTIRAILQSAYYNGATLDYQILIYDGMEDREVEKEMRNGYQETIDTILDDLFYVDYSIINAGMVAIQKKNAKKWIEKTISKLSKDLEKIYEDLSEYKLEKVGGFSNGEAIYKEI